MTDTGWHEPLSRARAAGVESSHDHRHRPPSPISPSSSAPHPCAPKTSSPSPATAPASSSTPPRSRGSRHPARSSRASPTTPSRTTASRPASARSPPRSSPPSAAPQLQASLIRSHAAGTGAEVEREVVRALQLLRLQTLATGHTGVRPVVVETYAAMLNAGITPIVREYGSLGCSGDLAPLSHVALAAMGEGDVRDAVGRPGSGGRRAAPRHRHRAARAAREGGPRAHQRHRRHARDAAARAPRPVGAARHGRRRRGDVDRESARHRCRLRRRPDGAAPAGRAGGIRREPARVPRRLADRRVAPRPGRLHARAGRVLAALRAAGARRRPRHRRLRRARSRSASCRRPSTTRSSPTTAASSPTATSTARRSRTCSTSSRSPSPTSPRSRSAAPTARSIQTRSHGLPPFLAHEVGVDSGPHDRAVRRGRDRLRAQAARGAGIRRLDPVVARCRRTTCRWAGRPRASCAAASTGSPGCSRSRCSPAPARSTCARRCSPGPATGAVRDLVRTVAARSGPRPLPLTRHRGGDRARRSPAQVAARRRRSSLHDDVDRLRPRVARRARQRAHREELGRRGRQAHADEQPRSRGRRAPRRPRRLRRHRQGGAQLGGVRRDRAHPRRARARRDAARAVRQAGRRVPHARVGAARADRELEPRGRLGDVARVPPARAARPHDVRADDRRLVDLHRHAGHPAGHVRDLRGRRTVARPRRSSPAR